MHRALLVDEIAAAIVREVVLNLGASKWELTSLARTCRSLSEPALDVLWESPLLWNLAQCMNADIWTICLVEHYQAVSNGYGERLVRHELYSRSDSLELNTSEDFLRRSECYFDSWIRKPILLLCQTCEGSPSGDRCGQD
jgi:hypothetical protein